MKKREISELQDARNMYKRLYEERSLKVKDLEEHVAMLKTQMQSLERCQGSEIHRMLEIIRWSINPKTAERPEPEDFPVNKYMI